MTSTSHIQPATNPTSTTRRPRRPRLVATGAAAVVVAVLTTTLAAAVARAAGVEFEIPDDGETIPLSGIAFVTGVCSSLGVVIALALGRWSARPAPRFVRTAVGLTALSLIPPFVSGADAGTVAALVALHLVAAAVMIPALAWSLRRRDAERAA